MNYIEYRDIRRYKNMLLEDVLIDMSPWGIVPVGNIIFNQFQLYTNGVLSINRYFCWDGASGPTIDTVDCIWPSCVHDVLCEMIRLCALPPEMIGQVNQCFQDLCLKCGMDETRSKFWRMGVDIGVPVLCEPDKSGVEYTTLFAPREE